MRVLTPLGVSVAFAFLLGIVGPKAAACDPLGNVQFVCGQNGPEDLAVLPGSEWVVASGDTNADETMRLINVRDRSSTMLFPFAPTKERLDTKRYGACPGPLDPAERYKSRTHGLDLVPGPNSVHTLFVVHHGSRELDLGSRESVELLEVDARTKPPTFTWIGCVVAPDTVGLNAVVGLPDGGMIATNFAPRGADAAAARAKLQAGQNNGELWEWHFGTGWKMIPGSESSAPNGLVMSKDGKWLYIAGYGNKTFVRVSRGQTPVKKDEIQLTFKADNLRWAPDGMIFATGQDSPPVVPGGTAQASPNGVPAGTSVVAKINPDTLKVQELIRYPYNEAFRFSTVTVQIGKELWVGSNRGDRIARFPAPGSQSQ
jgi:sugar lactone lactonase YvrE